MTDKEKEIWNSAIDAFSKEFIAEGDKHKYLRHIWIKNTCKLVSNKLKYRKDENIMEESRTFKPGDIVVHFKRETYKGKDPNYYLYKIIGIGQYTEADEKSVVYQLLYEPDQLSKYHKGSIVYRPYDMFMSEVDHDKYPDIKQKYRFEKYDLSTSTKVTKYKTKPCEIEAIQWNGNNSYEILEFVGNDDILKHRIDYVVLDGKECPCEFLEIETLEGTMKASVNDYIIKGLNGEFYPCKPDIFEKKYEKVV